SLCIISLPVFCEYSQSLAHSAPSPYTTLFRSARGGHGEQVEGARPGGRPPTPCLRWGAAPAHPAYLPGTVPTTPWTNQFIDNWRSEEHTSELQSHLNLVCRLLHEKKKLYSSLY